MMLEMARLHHEDRLREAARDRLAATLGSPSPLLAVLSTFRSTARGQHRLLPVLVAVVVTAATVSLYVSALASTPEQRQPAYLEQQTSPALTEPVIRPGAPF
jgi:hypothetical protein